MKSRSQSVILGLTLLLVGFLVLVSARLIPFAYLALVLVSLAVALRTGNPQTLLPRPGVGLSAIAAFILFAAASAAWAVEPSRTLIRVGLAAISVAASFVLIRVIQLRPNVEARSMALGLWIGFFVGLSFFFIEAVSNQAIRIWLYNTLKVGPELLRPARYYTWAGDKLVAISDLGLSRTITPMTILLWPVLLAALATVARPWRNALTVVLAGLAVAVVVLSPNTTSKIAIVLALVTFAIAGYARRFVVCALALAWILSCLATLPAGLLMYRYDLHNADWLKPSAQQRIIFWKNTVELTLKAPILGVGADMSYVLAPAIDKSLPPDKFEQTISRHAHSTFLQTWFELGIIGAFLLTAAGLGVLWEIRQLDADVRPFAFAMFASAGPYLAASYGMWQTWYAALFGLAVVLFAIAQRALVSMRPVVRE